MSGRFSTGVSTKGRRAFDYSGVASSGVFRQALEDSEEEGDAGRPGRVNYVALAEKDRRTVDDNPADDPEADDEVEQEGYDDHFEEMQRRRRLVVQGDSNGKSVRYMDGLKAAAEKRKREQTINYEKIAAKQMQREGKDFETKGRFLTEGYKNMLMLNKEFEEEDQEKEKYNQDHSAVNRSDMTNFFRRMYAQEMTFGGPRGPIEGEGGHSSIQIEFAAGGSDSEREIDPPEQAKLPSGGKMDSRESQNAAGTELAQIQKERSRSQSKERAKGRDNKIDDEEQKTQKQPVLSREEKILQFKQRMLERKQKQESEPPE